jgi:hypothetical protein
MTRQPVLVQAIEDLARAGEKAGFSVEDMIRLLNAGITVETLLDIIGRNLQAFHEGTSRSYRWIM